jgi:hypothetical protein
MSRYLERCSPEEALRGVAVLSTALTSMQGTVTRGVETAGTHLTILISAAFTRLLKTVVSMLAAPALGVDASTIAQQRLSVAALRALSLPLLGADGGLCLADVGLPTALTPLLAWGASVEGLLGTGECVGDVAHRLVACVDAGSSLFVLTLTPAYSARPCWCCVCVAELISEDHSESAGGS